jgi:hypothetical protein
MVNSGVVVDGYIQEYEVASASGAGLGSSGIVYADGSLRRRRQHTSTTRAYAHAGTYTFTNAGWTRDSSGNFGPRGHSYVGQRDANIQSDIDGELSESSNCQTSRLICKYERPRSLAERGL